MTKFPESVWWIGGVVATAILLFGATRADLTHLPPESPFDNTRSGHAQQWRFLHQASTHVPAGVTFTIRAAEPDTEMNLYVMAVGLLPQATAIPRTYYGQSVADSSPARFVMTFGDVADDLGGAGRTIAVAGGTVTDLGSPQP